VLGVGIIGLGRRFHHIYAPLVGVLPTLRLAAVCGRNPERARALALQHGTIATTSVDELLGHKEVDLVIACVEWRENARVYREIAACDKPALIETPLATNFADACEVAEALARRPAATTVAEQYPHRPVERLKQQLIADGVFGRVFHAFNDGIAHEYHGASLIRSYLGRERRLVRVAALEREVPLTPHRLHRNVFFPGERLQHAILEFDGDCSATHHWSWLAYESPIRARRAAGFLGTLGASWGEECVAFHSMDDEPVALRLERRSRVVDGLEVPHEIIAFRGREPLAAWRNPFPNLPFHEELLATGSLLNSAIETARVADARSVYPPDEALEDHRVAAAISAAAKRCETILLPHDAQEPVGD